LVMELIEGDTLADRIAKGPIPLEETLTIARQIAAALEFAHEHGVVHRDLKPANVKVGARVKVLDFGLAKMEAAAGCDDTVTDVTRAGMILGTAAYMSPEQAKGRAVDARSDIFSFGVLLYEMVSGRRAFKGDNAISTIAAILHQEPRPLREVAAGVTAELEDLICRCLAKDPAERFPNMGDVRKVLEYPAKATGRGSQSVS